MEKEFICIIISLSGAFLGYAGAVASDAWLRMMFSAAPVVTQKIYRLFFCLVGLGMGSMLALADTPLWPWYLGLLFLACCMMHTDMCAYIVSDAFCILLCLAGLLAGWQAGLSVWHMMSGIVGIGATSFLIWWYFRKRSILLEGEEFPVMGLGDVKAMMASAPLLGMNVFMAVCAACLCGIACCFLFLSLKKGQVAIPFLIFYLPCWWLTLVFLV